jgi:hypothetical protein
LHRLLSVLLSINHLVVLLLIDLSVVGGIAGSQQPGLFLKLVVLLDLSAARQAPRRETVDASAAANSKFLPNLISLHPKRETRDQECEGAAHDHARRVAPAEVRLLRAVREMCEAMVGSAEYAWSTPDDGAACSRIVTGADVVFPGSGWGWCSHGDGDGVVSYWIRDRSGEQKSIEDR